MPCYHRVELILIKKSYYGLLTDILGNAFIYNVPCPFLNTSDRFLTRKCLWRCLMKARISADTIGRYMGYAKSLSAYRLSVKFHRYANPAQSHRVHDSIVPSGVGTRGAAPPPPQGLNLYLGLRNCPPKNAPNLAKSWLQLKTG